MILIGASFGGMNAVQGILRRLPDALAVPVAIVLHRDGQPGRGLCDLLAHGCRLPVHEVVDKEPILPSHIYLAPPDYHLLVEPDCFSLSVDEPVFCARPSIDVLFESAADTLGARAIAVVLTGASRDGAAGAAKVQRRGGTVVVQSPETAEAPLMPASAREATHTRWVVTLEAMPVILTQLVDELCKTKR